MAAKNTSPMKRSGDPQDEKLRLECLRLAVDMRTNSPRSEATINVADNFFNYVKNGLQEN